MSIKVYVHIGPPKTATSAIQNWMQQNRKILMQQRIYYPSHSLDENGVSSGNVLNIFDRSADKVLSISKAKVDKVLAQCEENKCSVLLLSSEFFFFQVEDLLTLMPEAKLIVYIRFPLEVIESSYNQAVKRHNQTIPLGINKEPQAYHLILLEKMLQKFGQSSFIIRFYSQELFVGGNIVSDLFSVIGGKEGELSISPTKVNPSYSFQALEFKRWLNCFLPSEYQNRVDQLMQSYLQGTEPYSLIKPADYQRYVEWFSFKLDAFFQSFPVDGYQQFVASIKNKPQKKYIKQDMSLDQFSLVTDYLIEADVGLTQMLGREAGKCELAIKKRPDFYKVLKDAIPTTYKIKTRIREWYFLLSRMIKKIFFSADLKQPQQLGVRVTDLIRMRAILKIDDDISDGEVFREMALYCEQNGEVNLAYRLMLRANDLRPNGPVILTKIAEYKALLNIQDRES
jgi:hypothetical protein